MSFDAMAWAAKRPCKNSLNKLVLLMLANYADENYSTYPSYKHLAKLCECNERSVMRAVKSLEEDGAIKIRKRFTDDGKQTSNLFVLQMGGGDKFDTVGVTEPAPDTVRDIQNNNKQEGGDNHDKVKTRQKYPPDFEEWWNVYPRNDGSKKKAFDVWKRATDREIDVRDLYLATARFKQSCHGKDKKFIPHATTWLNQGRWETVEQAQALTTNRNSLAG